MPPWKRPANMMFQSYALFPHMSVADNIAFGLKQDGVPKSEIRDRVAEAVKLVQLEGRENRRPDQLSGGQKQRVALARAIIKRPKVLLLDEPLGALDKKLRERTQFELVNIQESLGLTFVIVTHDQEEAMTVSTRMAIMNEGRVGQLGTPGEMYEYPTSRFVADFLGDVNVLEARVVEAGRDQVRVHSAQAGCDIVADRGGALVAGETVWVAIRPEKFTLVQGAAAAGIGQLHGRRGLGHRLSGRRLDLPCAPRQRCGGPLHPGQPAAPAGAPDHLGGPRLPELGCRRQRDLEVMSDAREGSLGRAVLIGLPYLWLLLFFLVPFAIVLKLSFSEVALAQPPYLPLAELLDEAGYWFLQVRLNLSNFMLIFQDNLYIRAYLTSLQIAAISTILTLIIGFPDRLRHGQGPRPLAAACS